MKYFLKPGWEATVQARGRPRANFGGDEDAGGKINGIMMI